LTRQPDPSELAQAAFLLRLSARPVILAGGGVAAAGAEDELARIAEKLDAPVMTTWNGKGTISDRNEFSAGCMFGLPAAVPGLEAADTVFALGTTFDAGPDLELPAQMVQVDVDPDQLGRRYPLRLGVAADARAALVGILEALEAPNPLKGVPDRASVAPADRTAPGRAAQLRKAALRRARSLGADRIAALEAIRSALPDNATILHRDGGSAPWFFPFFEVAEPGTWLPPGPTTDFPVAEAAAAAGAAPGAVVMFCEEAELIPHLRELEGLEEPGDLTFVVFSDRGDEEAESALSEAAGETGLRIVVTSGVGELATALRRAAGTPNHTIIESDLQWSPHPA
jgi:acetolactate synthase-1/2/3 large subunit